jgi:peptidoglycan/LPS O-acetylase OafA/YrhL
MKKIDNLTGLRAFAALSVVLMHVRYGTLADKYGPLAFLFQNQGLGVDVFFVLSGFILAYVHHRDFMAGLTKNALTFFWVRLARIYPVHLVMLLIAAFILPALFRDTWPDGSNAVTFIANLLLIHAWGVTDGLTFNQVSWTISAEWGAYLCFPIIAFLTRRWPLWSFAFLALACAIAVPFVVVRVLENGLWTLKCLLYFTAGYSAYQFGALRPDSRWWRLGGVVLGPLIVFCFWAKIPYFPHAFALLAVAFILCLFKSGPIYLYANSISVYLGEISYSLYMTHVVTLFVLRRVAGDILPLWIEMPVILIFAALMYYLVERPFRGLMRAAVRCDDASTLDFFPRAAALIVSLAVMASFIGFLIVYLVPEGARGLAGQLTTACFIVYAAWLVQNALTRLAESTRVSAIDAFRRSKLLDVTERSTAQRSSEKPLPELAKHGPLGGRLEREH